MLELIILNLVLIGICVIGAILCKKFIKTDKGKRIALIVASLSTIACHYSSLLYHLIKDGTAMGFLISNPNLILPIYPCNVVMWCCLIQAFIKFDSKFFKFLTDYIFLFGIVSALVGMFVNVDFIRNPTLLNYDVTKGIVAHAVMLFNIILLPTLGFFKLNLFKNVASILISILSMFVIGCYCNLVFRVVGSESYAFSVNSMFILHSPFDGVDFLTYPFIAGIAVVFYFIALFICELIFVKKGERSFDKLFKSHKS